MRKILSAVFTLFCCVGFAQSYTLSTYTSPYVQLSNPVPVVIEGDDDDNHWNDPIFTVPFGFEFQINGQHYDAAVQLGPGANFAFVDLLQGTLSFCGLFDDIADVSAISDQDSSVISYQITGTTGNRIATVQYEDVGFYNEIYGDDSTAHNRMDFQIRFFENGGVIEIHYGAMTIPTPEVAFDSEQGPSFLIATDINFASETVGYAAIITGDPSDPSLAELSEEGNDSPGLIGLPESGRVYRLTPYAGNVGLADIQKSTLKLYPTLADENITIEHSINSNYRIFDITGKQVKVGNLDGKPIHIADLKSGPYIIIIDGTTKAAKFIKR